jgi:hypothetical protein
MPATSTRFVRHRRLRGVFGAGLVLTLLLGATACQGDETEPAPSPETTTSPPAETGSTPSTASPSPSPTLVPTTSGWLGETLTLRAGDTTLLATGDSTSLSYDVPVEEARSFQVFFTIENTGDTAFRGAWGADAVIDDELGNTSSVVVDPAPEQLNATPGRYGLSNRNLAKAFTLAPGETVKGMLLFQMYGGYREITIKVPVPGGETGAWVTNYSV